MTKQIINDNEEPKEVEEVKVLVKTSKGIDFIPLSVLVNKDGVDVVHENTSTTKVKIND